MKDRKRRNEVPDAPTMGATTKIEAMVNACAPKPEPAIHRSEPLRLIDIDICRYGVIRSFAWVRDGRTDIRSITLDEVSARQLLHDLVRTLL